MADYDASTPPDADGTLLQPQHRAATPDTTSTTRYFYRYGGAISSTTSLSSIPVGAIRLGSVTS